MSRARKNAGGKAGGAGFGFQADVATWLAAHMLVRLPVGGRFGINNDAIPSSIRLETGKGLDDIELGLDDGGAIHVQAKTRPNLSPGEKGGLYKTLGQLARLVADIKASGENANFNRGVAVLAVREDAPRTLDTLNAGCRAFDLGGEWQTTKAQRSQNEEQALGLFETLAGAAWAKHRGNAASEADLADMARYFRIERFSMDEGGSDWREASRLIGRHLYGGEANGEAPLTDLAGILFKMIGSGAPADRAGLLRELRRKGHKDVGAPGFEADIKRLADATEVELARLAGHATLPLGGGVPIIRSSDDRLLCAVRKGSALIVGEPGAGKTGALVNAATKLKAEGQLLFLSVDRFPGVAIAEHLQSELRLEHRLSDVLAAFPGPSAKFLIIDALDAARGGPSQEVFASLIEEVRERLAEEWTVIASIRTFDLKNGHRYAKLFTGTPPDPDFIEPGFKSLSHFLIPRLDSNDLAAAAAAAPELKKLIEAAPPALESLLHNIFNLSLAAELIAGDADAASFSAIRSQSGLIEVYEDARLTSTALQQAASATVGAMAMRRSLMVRKVFVQHGSLDQLIQTGVIAEVGDKVSFAHHILFDHVAGRFYLEDDAKLLASQLAGDATAALQLAPALRFAVERMWRDDAPGRPSVWALIDHLFGADDIDAVLTSVALRTAVENVANADDLKDLIGLVAVKPGSDAVTALMGRLSRFVGMEVDSSGGVDPARAVAWARLAEAAIATGERRLADPTRFLLQALFEKADLTELALLAPYGKAARGLLAFAWDHDPRIGPMATSAIRFVGKSFASDKEPSRALLGRIIEEPHFSAYADQEGVWLGEQIIPIAAADPSFAAQIYAAMFQKSISDEATSYFGGQPSRIMPLSSNRRQDFQHGRWQLGRAMGEFLKISPAHATRALIDSNIGDRDVAEARDQLDLGGGRSIELRRHDYELNHWSETDPGRGGHDDDMLAHYVSFLRSCTAAQFAESVEAAARDYATAPVWARILGVGAERVSEVGDLLWPFVQGPGFLDDHETMRDAINFIAAAYPSRQSKEREAFETMALDQNRLADHDEREYWMLRLGRLLRLVEEDQLALEAMRELRRTKAEKGELVANTPLTSFRIGRGDSRQYERERMRKEGINLDEGPDSALIAATEKLERLIERTPEASKARAIARLWRETGAMVALIDANEATLHHSIARRGWGRVAAAAERIAASPNFVPGTRDMPPLDELLLLLVRLSTSIHPAPTSAA